jgi:hypothetical protein
MKPFIILCMIGAGILITLAGGLLSRRRIRKYIESQGGRVTTMKWNPLRGWHPGWSEMVYRVQYVDKQGAQHDAYCAGDGVVRFIQDNIKRSSRRKRK